jgi:competence protein ComEC
MKPLSLLHKKREWFYLFIGLFSLFLFHLSYLFIEYKDITKNEIYYDKYIVKNIYKKEKFDVIKLVNNKITFFTSVSKEYDISQLDKVEIFFITKELKFIEYLQGFYKPSFGLEVLDSIHYQKPLVKYIASQHQNPDITSIYKALFFAIPLPQHLTQQNAKFGVSHLFAISGFHLGILLGVLYFILQTIYTPIHNSYLPYRNKKLDILIISSIVIFLYLLYIDIVPSFLRSFVMFLIGIIILRANIKLFSFSTLLLTLLIIIILFPKLLFSLSLWFSLFGVFYIFLFLQYFSAYHKIVQFILFHLFIFGAMNPIVHYFFPITSYEQLSSPLLTLIFTLFYPLSLFLHFIGLGDTFDSLLSFFINYKVYSYEIYTPFWIFCFFIIASLISIWSKKIFFLYICFMIVYNLYIYT